MPDKFLRKKDIALRLDTSWQEASRILAKNGVFAIDFGPGRSKGLHWLESAVDAAILAIHMAAQPKPKKPRRASIPGLPLPLDKIKAAELYNYLANGTDA